MYIFAKQMEKRETNNTSLANILDGLAFLMGLSFDEACNTLKQLTPKKGYYLYIYICKKVVNRTVRQPKPVQVPVYLHSPLADFLRLHLVTLRSVHATLKTNSFDFT